jgi:hypothetical protein
MISPGLIFEQNKQWLKWIGIYSISLWGAFTAALFLMLPSNPSEARHIIDTWRAGLSCFIMMYLLALLADSIKKKPWQHWTLYGVWLIASCGCAKLLITYVK